MAAHRDFEPETSPAGQSPLRALPLSPLEAAAGFVIDTEEATTFTIVPAEPEPFEALITVITDVLARGPTYVSFSGGRDSSGVLAAAVHAARRHGLADPIPVTQRFAEVASTEEREWQELVVDHLGLTRWEVIEITEELDLLGEIARDALLTHGLLYPPNAFFFVPVPGARPRWQPPDGLRRRRHPGPLAVGTGAVGPVRPGSARAAGCGAGGRGAGSAADPAPGDARPGPLRVAPWLRPDAQRALNRVVRRRTAAEPRRWDHRLAFLGHTRRLRMAVHAYDGARVRSVRWRS